MLRGVRCVRRLWSGPIPSRGPYGVIGSADLAAFERILGKQNVLTEDLDSYNTDFMKWFKGSSRCVLLPSSSAEVSAVLRHCFEARLAVVPQSGNTGLVGGSIPVHDEIVVSLRNLNKHFNFEPDSGILECDAGFILEELDARLGAVGYMMPLDLGAKGACLIGGNIATAAGGLRLLRFGSLHSHLLGLTAVIADEKGSIVKFGSTHRKDNTSLHTHHAFVGSEGQLGIVTQVAMTAVPRLPSRQIAMFGMDSFEKCRRLLRLAKERLGEILSAFEMLDVHAMRCLLENEDLKNVLHSDPPFSVLIETLGSSEEHDRAKLENFIIAVTEEAVATDGVLAESSTEAAYMWSLRETAPLALLRDGYVYKHDVSLPLEHFYALTEAVRERLRDESCRVVTYGHMGDGNSHLNVTAKLPSEDIAQKLYPFIYEWVVSHGGSISAEHGIGQAKRHYSALGKDPVALRLAAGLKDLFDPRRILSPYKMILE